MFPHEVHLKRALEDCRISQLVVDLGRLYVELAAHSPDQELFKVAMAVEQILKRAAVEIADLGSKPHIPHPLDKLTHKEL